MVVPKSSPVQKRRVKVQHRHGFHGPSVVQNTGGQGRLLFVIFVLCLMFTGLAGRLMWLTLVPPVEPRASLRAMPAESLRRGNIYDRNGVMLATTLNVYSLYADPKRVLDADEVQRKLLAVLPDLNRKRLDSLLSQKHRRFVWIQRRLTPDQAQQIHDMGLPGLAFRQEQVRVYPQQHLVSHVLGGVNVDGKGIAGVEASYNSTLMRGEDVRLAVDVGLQEALRTSVSTAMQQSGSVAGWGVVMHAKTGDILALSSLPDYDPNHLGAYKAENRLNRATLGSYEMGSTFKLFTLAQGIADGHVTPDTLIDCREPISIAGFRIRDYHAKKSWLTATEILRYSSNIGAATIADMSGPQGQKRFYDRLGFLNEIDAGLPEVGPVRYPGHWGRVHTMTISYGHGMMVTPLHLVAAVGALVHDGYVRQPHVVLDTPRAAPRKVIEARYVPQIRDLMRDVVQSGSGRNSQVLGLDIGGKTGTAEKVSASGGYSQDKNLVSFVAAVPLNDPEYVVLVMLDEPKKGFETGGRSAAPAVKNFLQQAAARNLRLQPDYVQIAQARAKLKPARAPLVVQPATQIAKQDNSLPLVGAPLPHHVAQDQHQLEAFVHATFPAAGPAAR